jgi:hypothetical protein
MNIFGSIANAKFPIFEPDIEVGGSMQEAKTVIVISG